MCNMSYIFKKDKDVVNEGGKGEIITYQSMMENKRVILNGKSDYFVKHIIIEYFLQKGWRFKIKVITKGEIF